ncbi:hypothetical protein KNP414_01381 [Paenibacillus mucilaginosus KNP414]|uniref:Uncharacterized protein n=1 Tax=Paenibacillus mucilaginosus (strain KNP414) TaxID=1036673 RepID=F8FL26_PAEMK|nr:hypothetical protein KNP414_01381 [Paenibacillus mucilaginosus KNP414]
MKTIPFFMLSSHAVLPAPFPERKKRIMKGVPSMIRCHFYS